MRALVIALMIALLPLRGWVGDAMAQQLAVASVQGSHAAPAQHADCALHGEPAVVDASDHGGNCGDCQVCHTMAMEAPVVAIMSSECPALPASGA